MEEKRKIKKTLELIDDDTKMITRKMMMNSSEIYFPHFPSKNKTQNKTMNRRKKNSTEFSEFSPSSKCICERLFSLSIFLFFFLSIILFCRVQRCVCDVKKGCNGNYLQDCFFHNIPFFILLLLLSLEFPLICVICCV